MTKRLKRVPLTPDTDLLHVIENVHIDKSPRLIERNGQALAVVIAADDYVEILP